jgi:DNA-binding protein H-NS
MTKTYAQLIKQIEVLQQDAEKVRRKEVDAAIGRVREVIAVYHLSAEDLGFGPKGKRPEKAAVPAKPKAGKAAKPAAPVKYRNGTGGTWGGRGKRPQWLRDALNAGQSLADFAAK